MTLIMPTLILAFAAIVFLGIIRDTVEKILKNRVDTAELKAELLNMQTRVNAVRVIVRSSVPPLENMAAEYVVRMQMIEHSLAPLPEEPTEEPA